MNGATEAFMAANLASPKILLSVAWKRSLVPTKMWIIWCAEGVNGPETSLALIVKCIHKHQTRARTKQTV